MDTPVVFDMTSSTTRSHDPELLTIDISELLTTPETPDERYVYIKHDPIQNLFVLGNQSMQYILQLDPDTGKIFHLHWGSPVSTLHANPRNLDVHLGGDEYSATYTDFSVYGDGDDRPSAMKLQNQTTGRYSGFHFIYHDHAIYRGKPRGTFGPEQTNLPATYVESPDEAKTLTLTLRDAATNVRLHLLYTVFRDEPALARQTVIQNHGSDVIQLSQIASWSLDCPPQDYAFLQLSGAWAREAQAHWTTISCASGQRHHIGDTEGSKTHRSHPFLALAHDSQETSSSETSGEVRGFSLVYSGAFEFVLQVNQWGLLRLNLGLNPATFTWRLEPQETFVTPECIGVFSSAGLCSMSQSFHRLYRTRLSPAGPWRDCPRPIVLNTWEALYFDVHHDDLVALAKASQGRGIEVLVLDDGWFSSSRTSDAAGLGDWTPNVEKLPGGLEALATEFKTLGFDFGLWVEPESVSRNSSLYREHPEWVVEQQQQQQPSFRSTERLKPQPDEMRNQLLLDLTNTKVQEYLIETFTTLFRSASIQYVKWDHNRFISHPYGRTLPPTRQGEFSHRYILGLYHILRTLTGRFPHILFESCSGGGGRFDPGMLAYMPQSWASDNTDANERLAIQWGWSYVYPLSMMSNHVSSVPNHQVNRTTSWESRVALAHFGGSFGYELDLRKLKDHDVAGGNQNVQRASQDHHDWREWIHHGTFLRLRNPFQSNWPAWMVLSVDATRGLVLMYQRLMQSRRVVPPVLLRGLRPRVMYEIQSSSSSRRSHPWSGRYTGQELMIRGFHPLTASMAFTTDFQAQVFVLSAISSHPCV